MLLNLTRAIAVSYLFVGKVRRRLKMIMLRSNFAKVGRGVIFDPDGRYTFSTIEIGDFVFIGPGAVFSADRVRIRIGDWVMMGPCVTIMAGDHDMSVVGTPMRFVEEKRAGNDQDVTIEEEVWIGANATILKGVTVGRGSVIGAGAVVTKSIPPYSVAVGSPARVIKARLSQDQIAIHEAKLYTSDLKLDKSGGDPQ